ncbi:MAG: phosphonoacetaldehyde hydrolase [Desulfobacterales bacterium]|jgi:phosphonoacetaldehyde hydrolase
MTVFVRSRPYRGAVKGIILDWAGTAVDYGCMGPAAVFVAVFEAFGIRVSVQDARRFMGLMKKDHIRGICTLPGVIDQWREAFGRAPNEGDIDALYAKTEPMMVDAISRHADPIPGLVDMVTIIRKEGLKIGSSTGYTRPMMDVLAPEAKKNGYAPDAVLCASDVPAGRPYPWMCFKNAILLGIYPLEAIVKIGDTVADIEEGLNAGMWTVGLTKSGNELGLDQEAADQLPTDELTARLDAIEKRFRDAGAHYVAEGIWECLPVIDDINRRLAVGEQPIQDRQHPGELSRGK